MRFSDYVTLNPPVSLQAGVPVPFIPMDAISPGRRWVRASEQRQPGGSSSRFAPGDTLFARITPCLENGKIAQYLDDAPGMGSTEFFVLRARDDLADPGFVYYFARREDFRATAEKSMSGASGRQRASAAALAEFKCDFPGLEAQRRVTAILTAYDELVENNYQRSELLMGIARALYREWFVNFRFPGYERCDFVTTAAGAVPKDWKVATLESLFSSHIGGGWGKDTADATFSEAAAVIRGTDIPSARLCQIDSVPHRFHKVSNLRSRKLTVGDIIIEVSGGSKDQPVGRALLVTRELLSAFTGDVICASFCKRVQPNGDEYCPELLYLSLLEGYQTGEIEQFQVQSTGLSNLKWADYISRTTRVIPPRPLQRQFQEHVAPLLGQVATLGLQTQNLLRTRDLLIPRLTSAQIGFAQE